MSDIVAILLGVVLLNQFVLGRFPALFLLPQQPQPAAWLAGATVLALALAGAPAWWLQTRLLPAVGLPQLALVAHIVAVAGAVRLLRLFSASPGSAYHDALQRHSTVVLFNAVSAQLALLATHDAASGVDAAMKSAAAGGLLGLLLYLCDGVRHRLAAADLPAAVRGVSIGLLTAALISLAFAGLDGIWRG